MPHETFTQYVEIVMFFVVGSMVGVMSDFQKAQQKKILDANEQIRRMDRLSLLGQLSAGLAHEIRNPLGSLMGSVEILDKEIPKDNPKREFVEIIGKELRRLNAKLDEFLRFARPAAPHPVSSDLSDIVRESVKLVERQVSKSGIRIELQLAKNLQPVPLDVQQVKQVLLNLLLNAVQACTQSGRIVVCTWADDHVVGFSVEDNGPGIPKSAQERIFDPFFTTKPDGTGLGLSIVKQLVDVMQGSIQIVSPEKGVRLEVRIPNAKS
jgi:signal transduction histidine kinase